MGSTKKVLIVGSGPIKIAEAAEFDYSTSQALKALKEEGIETVLVNSNVATLQTSYRMADRVYMLPTTSWAVERVIESERPDGIMIGFGGQTALNVGYDLYKSGKLNEYGVKVLGTPIEGVEKALSREKFRETMIDAGIPVPPSFSARSVDEAVEKAKDIGYPVMIRVSFNLGGRGSTVAWDETSLKREVARSLSQSYIGEILVEKYLRYWKELEYEVIMDSKRNSAVVACIENMDPMGVHTGESVVVAPCQTLDNLEYQAMRSAAIKVAESISLIGECNVQFALDPQGYTYYAIETNPRMSRSSALASKATGYPLAYVAAKLALGYKLYEIKNTVSGVTCACFEPSLDYVVVKSPRWDLQKFEEAEVSLGTEMKSIGEVMSIGRSLEEALQKAARMLDIGVTGVFDKEFVLRQTKESALRSLSKREPYWFLYASAAFYYDASVDEVYEVTGIDRFFLGKVKRITDFASYIMKKKELSREDIETAKRLGFSDRQIARILTVPEEAIRKIRQTFNLHPVVKQIDTLAGERPAMTNYLYITYNGSQDDLESSSGNKLLLVGPGGFRIGVSVEFDWSLVSALEAAKNYFDEVAVINYNPETVSTDWDVARKLYFDEISPESIAELFEKEGFRYVATFAGGQIGNNIAPLLESAGYRILGTSGTSVDKAEDRKKFSELLEKLRIRQPPWSYASSLEEVKKVGSTLGYPVLVRPSYVLSGSAMAVAWNEEELLSYLKRATSVSPNRPVVISKFLVDAIEAEIDAISDGKGVLGVTLEHIEEAGIHSGDATMSVPYRLLSDNTVNLMRKYALSLANELEIKGPFNLQFVVKDGEPQVIELNLRASRSMPFSSKAKGVNLIEQGIKALMEDLRLEGFVEPRSKSWAVKSAQFSWAQLRGAYPFLGPEMRSTGEAASFGFTFEEALLKSWLSVSPNRIPQEGSLALVYGEGANSPYLKEAAQLLEKYGLKVFTLEEVPVSGAEQVTVKEAQDLLVQKRIGLIVTDGYLKNVDYKIRRAAADFNVPLILNGRLGANVARALNVGSMTFLDSREYGGIV